jgi:hypothetical protein
MIGVLRGLLFDNLGLKLVALLMASTPIARRA